MCWFCSAERGPTSTEVATSGDDRSCNFCCSTPSSAPSTLVPSSSIAGVTLDDIIEQLQRMHADFGGRLDYLIDEMCQMNTRIGRIARR